jgi:tripartite-type tricarboxylate transporter receptor subunit TctC
MKHQKYKEYRVRQYKTQPNTLIGIYDAPDPKDTGRVIEVEEPVVFVSCSMEKEKGDRIIDNVKKLFDEDLNQSKGPGNHKTEAPQRATLDC